MFLKAARHYRILTLINTAVSRYHARYFIICLHFAASSGAPAWGRKNSGDFTDFYHYAIVVRRAHAHLARRRRSGVRVQRCGMAHDALARVLAYLFAHLCIAPRHLINGTLIARNIYAAMGKSTGAHAHLCMLEGGEKQSFNDAHHRRLHRDTGRAKWRQ